MSSHRSQGSVSCVGAFVASGFVIAAGAALIAQARPQPGSLMASDDAYEILLDKQPTGVVELPIERIVDDFPYFGAGANGGMPNPDGVLAVFQSEFDVAYEEGGLYILTMHPHITGHRSRVAGLEKLIVHMKSKPGV